MAHDISLISLPLALAVFTHTHTHTHIHTHTHTRDWQEFVQAVIKAQVASTDLP